MQSRRRQEERGTRRKGIQSVEIGLRVLDTLSSLGGPATLSSIAQASNMQSPQVHRYLQSLIVAGMVQQDAESGRYDLGAGALRLGLGALARIDAFAIADEAIKGFALRSGQTVQIAALGPLGPTIVRWHAGKPAVMTSFNIGSVLPLLQSATGHVFMAFGPRGAIEPLLDQELQASRADPVEARHLRERVRDQGYAHVDGTMIPGLQATAFPIFDLQGHAILTATMLTPASWRREDSAKAADELAAACGDISRKLGYSRQ